MLQYSKNTFKKHNSNSIPIKYLTTTVDILNTCHGVCGDDSYHKTMVNSSKFEPNPADFDENETLFEETNFYSAKFLTQNQESNSNLLAKTAGYINSLCPQTEKNKKSTSFGFSNKKIQKGRFLISQLTSVKNKDFSDMIPSG